MIFAKESEFEEEFIKVLKSCGWDDEGGVIHHPSESDLVDNWARILFENNKEIDRLNGCPLTDGEMAQILEQVRAHRTPYALNSFINGKTVAVTRDNPDDDLHYGKEVSLKIYDRAEIAGGQSRYQIAQQPHFSAKTKMLPDRRGDVMLLINGMPVIHVELKRSGVSRSQAVEQIEKYRHEGVFTGIFSLVQIFVAMNPDDAVYFANPGPDVERSNPNFHFHWADFNNEPQNDWRDVARNLLSIPMAHQLIGFYTVADAADGTLKVMRSYQYFAASRISDRVTRVNRDHDWGGRNIRGGFVWHTTGSGKTMTSFKSAQLIANSKDADKVVFLMDRIELGTQSLAEYRNFADDSDDVQATENTNVLIDRLKSDSPADTLIVTSIQKMSNIKREGCINGRDLETIREKRMVFIIDECHRSTFGEMLATIKETFPEAMYFGFTGTPIHEENAKRDSTTSTVFGNELHRYSIHDGIRDGNVLGFDPYMICTMRDADVRETVALDQAKAGSLDEAQADSAKWKKYLELADPSITPMAGYKDDLGKYHKGIEDYLPERQYGAGVEGRCEHRTNVVKDIVSSWKRRSVGGKFHAILATHSIPEAIEYFKLFAVPSPELKVTALFDPSIDNDGGAVYKEEGLIEVLSSYNEAFGKDFSISDHAKFKKDVSSRLAHKGSYLGVEKRPDQCLDLLIVVDQMLTGFDSKWVNTLYLDKVLKFEGLIQAFSRTNRLFGHEKRFGTICYYRRPHTMKRNADEALRLYSGDKPLGLFVEKLDVNIQKMDIAFREIRDLFSREGVGDMAKLPEGTAARAKFASLFKDLNAYLDAARVQGFSWEKTEYDFSDLHPDGDVMVFDFDENEYLTLAQRYKELAAGGSDSELDGDVSGDVPFDIEGYLTEIDTGRIDTAYMNANFTKWLKRLTLDGSDASSTQEALDGLHATFAALSQEEQKFANLLIHDIQSGDLMVDETETLRDLVTRYQNKAKSTQVTRCANALGVDADKLDELVSAGVDESSINEFGRFDALMSTLDRGKAKEFFERIEGKAIPPFKVNMKADSFLRKFIIESGIDIDD